MTSRVASSSRVASALDDALEEFTDLLNRGEQPDVEEFVRRHPELGPSLRPTLQTLVALYDSPAMDDSAAGDVPRTVSLAAQTLGDFRIVREVGRGGMGVVYEAEQISLGRRVALKVLPFAAMLDERQLVRFKNEARAAGTLNHPGIVPIHFVGCERGVHFYAMQFIEGQTLAEVIDELRKRSGVGVQGEKSR